ncbi:hypothetical protein NHX12_020130 [Muraenolepis orangiensis]|uniref:DNA polymerase epsilon subunit 2 n=1 Tax=Muraenolepis orangiensis TaxID=630683 RepID=A0A9Q0IY49_9TELE|nr:hypothetical protein NHX12_020130 [Muraenolepis orangiensis]
MDTVRKIKTKVSADVKMRGLMLRPDASKYLVEVLESVNPTELEDVIEKILDAVEKQPLSSAMIELSVMETAVQDCSQSCDENIDNVFNIIGAFDVPRYIYSAERKKFVPINLTKHPAPSLCGVARDKAELFRERYSILQQRTHRHELFTPPAIGSAVDESRNKFQLKTVEALLGCTAKLGEVIVLGMITQLKEAGMRTRCSIAYYGNLNFFGGPSTTSVKASAKLKQLEEENDDAMFVVLSDVWLDSVEVMEKIHTMFSGPEDPGPSTILPRPPLADHITEDFRQRIPFSVFTTNPCRIQYCSQEIVIIREDLVNKMCRNCVRMPTNSLDIPNHFVKTILSQGHLTPLPLYVSPVFWAYDYAMRVYPVPDVIIFADKYDPFSVTNADCLCVNPVWKLFYFDVLSFLDPSESLEADNPPERSGHIAVVDRNCMYVWGGYKNAVNHGFFDLYLPRNELWEYNMETGVWTKRITGGNLFTSMSGSCGVCVNGVLYLFAGHHARGNINRIFGLNLRAPHLIWEEMKDLKGLPPSCKDKLGCWVQGNRLIFFGGYGYAPQGQHRGTFEFDDTSSLVWNSPSRGWNNHIHILDLETSTWSQPITKGNTPSPRAAHACATLGNRGYVFGGRYKNFRLNDLYYIDMDTWEWHEMSVPQAGPSGRSWHSFTPVSEDHIFLFGGFTTERETLSDGWLYGASSNEWKPFKHNHTESPRLWHTACSGPDGEVFVFGGCANNLLSHQRAAHSNELLIFNLQPKSLVRYCIQAAVQHRERLASSWNYLPKHLLNSLQQTVVPDNS